jgi:hypothetical protein
VPLGAERSGLGGIIRELRANQGMTPVRPPGCCRRLQVGERGEGGGGSRYRQTTAAAQNKHTHTHNFI